MLLLELKYLLWKSVWHGLFVGVKLSSFLPNENFESLQLGISFLDIYQKFLVFLIQKQQFIL